MFAHVHHFVQHILETKTAAAAATAVTTAKKHDTKLDWIGLGWFGCYLIFAIVFLCNIFREYN